MKYNVTVGGNAGNTPVLAPKQMASLWAQYDAGAGIHLGVDVRHIGKQWADDAHPLQLLPVTPSEASARIDLGSWNISLKGAYAQVNDNKPTDRTYIASCYELRTCYWGAERSVIATAGDDYQTSLNVRLAVISRSRRQRRIELTFPVRGRAAVAPYYAEWLMYRACAR